jgi:6-phosphofructokinase 1
MIKKIAILTSGGDAPGMNSAIRAIVKKAEVHGIETFLVKEGYSGLYKGDFVLSSKIDLDENFANGGTIIGSTRFPQFKKLKIRKIAKSKLDEKKIDALVVIGGDGSYKGAQLLHELGVKTIALPGTIDNDISSTDFTIGYDTALNTIVHAIEKIRDTMKSHRRVAIVEVMGRGCGDLALFSGIATGSELIVTKENPKTIDDIVKVIKEQMIKKGKRSTIITVSENIFDDLYALRKEVEKKSGIITREISLSHIQRGGKPTAGERIMTTLMGIKSVDLLYKGKSGIALGMLNGKVVSTPIPESLNIKRKSRKNLTEKINKINQI